MWLLGCGLKEVGLLQVGSSHFSPWSESVCFIADCRR